MRRFSPWVCGPLTAFVLMTSGMGLPAANDDTRPAITGEEIPAPPERLKLEFSVFEVKLRETQGSIQTHEIIGLARDNRSSDQIAMALNRIGEPTLTYRGEAASTLNSPFKFFLGEEQPFVTTFVSPDTARSTMSQSSVSSGLSAEFTPNVEEDGDIVIKYDVDLDRAYTVERNGQTLIGRVRLSWEGETLLHEGEGAQVGRFVRQLEGKQVEFIFILRVAE